MNLILFFFKNFKCELSRFKNILRFFTIIFIFVSLAFPCFFTQAKSLNANLPSFPEKLQNRDEKQPSYRQNNPISSVVSDWRGGRVSFQQIPDQAQQVILKIERGASFFHPKDGSVFKNYERKLPLQARGYYREYTVMTPGVKHRGVRRIIAGGMRSDRYGANEYFYTSDHYETFFLVD